MVSGAAPACESDEDVALDAEHLLLLGRLGVVEAEQVQDAVAS